MKLKTTFIVGIKALSKKYINDLNNTNKIKKNLSMLNAVMIGYFCDFARVMLQFVVRSFDCCFVGVFFVLKESTYCARHMEIICFFTKTLNDIFFSNQQISKLTLSCK